MNPLQLSIAIGALAALLAPARTPAAGPPPDEGHHAHGGDRAAPARIPESMRVEHAEIHEELVAATKLKGRVGDAARELAKVLGPHFEREEEIALPPLGLLRALAKGPPTAEMRDVLAMTDALAADLPRMLEEHVRIGEAARKLEVVARAERDRKVEALAKKLQLHAKTEEEVFYPAALVVGKMVKGQG